MVKKALGAWVAALLASMSVAASAQTTPLDRVVSERFMGQFQRSGIPASFRASPDSRRFAYVAVRHGVLTGEKKIVVVDGSEEKPYDDIGASMPTFFSPDGKRVASGAKGGNKDWSVVVDGNEGKRYDSLLRGGNRVVFDSPDALHYLAETAEDDVEGE